jgi:hypothetical protein
MGKLLVVCNRYRSQTRVTLSRQLHFRDYEDRPCTCEGSKRELVLAVRCGCVCVQRDKCRPPDPKMPSLVIPAGPELPEDVMGLLLFYSAESFLELKNINREFNRIAKQHIRTWLWSWGDAYKILKSTFPTANENTLKNVATVVLKVDNVDLLTGITVGFNTLRKIAAYYALTQYPFNIEYGKLESCNRIFIWPRTEGADEAMKALSTALSNGALETLQGLYIFSDQIGEEGMKAFCTVLSSGALASLTHLAFRDNQIGDKGMKDFSDALSSGALASLQVLALHVNNIGYDGMKAFSGALSSGALASLTYLSLHSNQISDEGMKDFSDALSSGGLGSLEILILQAISIDFVDALKNGALPSLREIRVKNEPPGTHQQIKDALRERNPSLRTITVTDYVRRQWLSW